LEKQLRQQLQAALIGIFLVETADPGRVTDGAD
jgi:hypothetical protein